VNIVALLPMKGNSERVPGKNFRLLGSRPLYRWMLDALLHTRQISQVVINTDAPELLDNEQLLADPRVVLRERAVEIRGDFVSMNRIIQDDIDAVDADLYLMTHATNPFISSGTIARAIDALNANPAADSLFSVNRFQTRFYREDGSAINHDPSHLIRTQDLEPWFEENSCLYLFTRQSFARSGARIGTQPMMFTTPALESVDIDEPEDWQLAEALAPTMETP
jgi:CMP-N-acetylneuraminic acid synthetase